MQIDRLILDTPVGAIVPVRAIYYVTGCAFPPRAITTAIADGRQYADYRIFETLLHPGHVDAAGTLNAAAYGELEPYAEEVGRLCEAGASLIDQIQAMPAGVYISRAQLQSLVNETNDVCAGSEGDGLAPIAIHGQPMVSPAVRALVLQGFEPYTRGRRDRRPKLSKPRRRGLSSEEAEDFIEVKTIALGLWAGGGCRSMQRMLKVPSLDRYINDWGKRKVLAWLSAVDSRRPESKPGRRWPKQTK